MYLFMDFFDCLFIRRFFIGDDAGRAQVEQSSPTSAGYHSEPPPTHGSQAQPVEPLETGIPNAANDESSSGEEAALGHYFHGHSHAEDPIWAESPDFAPREATSRPGLLFPPSASSAASASDVSNEGDSGSDNGSNDEDEEEAEGETPRAGNSRQNNTRARSRDIDSSSTARTATQPIRLLSSEHMAVIGALIHHREVQPAPREVKWDNFIRTMAHLGFLVVPGGHTAGATYRFQVPGPNDLVPAGSEGEVVTAHKPHGSKASLSLGEMREIGSRFANAFGWSAETFGMR